MKESQRQSKFHLIDNIMGAVVFAIAAMVYGLTIEPTASFWDCPEFILCGYKLEVGHPPGAPFYMLAANAVSQLASDPSQVAWMVNMMNAMLSALCIMFLHWTITHLVWKLQGNVTTTYDNPTHSDIFIIELSGVVGALIYTFSDTFWFSAVEGEVYAFSSAFTAVVFWLILKWERHADEPHADRWLILIAYMTGLSIGVHLLNLLCLPAIVLVWYYRWHPNAELAGSLKALAVSFIILAGVLYGVIPGIVKVAGWFELLFVNTLHCPFNTGLYIYIIVLFTVIVGGIWFTSQRRLRVWNTALLCLSMIIIGYSSYGVILIRSSANPPMDQNSPDEVFTIASYLARDQYGQNPLIYGQAYTSLPEWVAEDNMMRTKVKKGSPVYKRNPKQLPNEPDQYTIVETRDQLVYAQNVWFPRMWDSSKEDAYENWMGGVKGHQIPYDYGGEMTTVKIPTPWENFYFFLSYQCNFMYWRYFMWNFCGRQNDIQGQGEREHGNWITGIPLIDNLRVGDQNLLPDELRENKGHNVFYGIPLLLGIIGFLWQGLRKGRQGIQQFWVVFFLFFMTGIAIVVYINQSPMQVRERDYAYAGSFYAFAIWCGIGVTAIYDKMKSLKDKMVKKYGMAKFCLPLQLFPCLSLLVPIQMATQTWDDHDRSHRFTCRDFGRNYLESCQEGGNPILFCDGDNDTFPLWYDQEVEGMRTDIRVCNLNYLPTDWYIDQQRRPNEHAPALPIPWKRGDYIGNKRNYIPINASIKTQVMDFYRDYPTEARQQFGEEPFELNNILRHWVCAEDESLHVIPTDTVYLNIDKEAVKRSGMMLPSDTIPDRMYISLKGMRGLHKGQLALLEVIAGTHWERPIYICSSVPSSEYLNLDAYLVTEGIAKRLTPFYHHPEEEYIDTEKTYRNVMEKFHFGGLSRPGLYIDPTSMAMCHRHRLTMAQLAITLVVEGKREKALEILAKAEREIPEYNVPLTFQSGSLYIARAYAQLGEAQKATHYIKATWHNSQQYLDWFLSMSPEQRIVYAQSYKQHCSVLYHLIQSAQHIDVSLASYLALMFDKYNL
ncbi:MAG: DUF2723 domain-containing protein [Prevotella sp.]|nr:DUF2723 domain-containing protein [Prevotella sp.]